MPSTHSQFMIVYCFPNEIIEYFCRQFQNRMLPVLSTLLLNRQLVLSAIFPFPFYSTSYNIHSIHFPFPFHPHKLNSTQLTDLTWLLFQVKSVELFTRDHQRDSQKKDACPLIPLNKLYYYFSYEKSPSGGNWSCFISCPYYYLSWLQVVFRSNFHLKQKSSFLCSSAYSLF